MQNILPTFTARRYCLLLAWVSLACGFETFFSLTQISQAQTVTTDITASGLGTQVPLEPPSDGVYNITGGTRAGPNLFHSFGQFSVGAGDVANFQNTLVNGAFPATSNILARVTGTNGSNPTLSSIFGAIQTTNFENANLFLMNPAGFLFGPNATVNVAGMVAFTSADYLNLTDSARFNATPNLATDALLTALPVVSFGFLGSNPGAITIQGSQFSVTDGQSISLVGGNISIESGTPDGGIAQPAQLSAPNGNILLASAASPGEFAAATLQPLPNADGASFTSFGSVTLAPGSSVDVGETNTVSIRGGQFILTVNNAALTTATNLGTQDTIVLSRGSTFVTATAGDEAGADVQIVGTSVQLNGASITSLSTGAGSGGAISVMAEDTVSLTNGTRLVSQTEGTGEGGNISVEATSGSVTISGFDLDGTVNGVVAPFLSNPLTGEPLVASGIYSLTSGSESGGTISIIAPTVSLHEGAVVATVTSGDTRGGNVSINSDTFELTSGASLLSSAGQNFTAPDFMVSGTGGGGDIIVAAADSVTISGGSLDLFALSNISTQTYNPVAEQALGQGHGGAITISAPNIVLEDGGSIVSGTQGGGEGGAVNIFAPNYLSVSGFSQDFGVGSAIGTSAAGAPSGNGGAITISGSSVTVENGGRIASDHSPGGNGGDLTVMVQDLTLRNGGSVTSSGSGDGTSGHIQLTATGTLSISGQFFDPINPGSGGWSVINSTTGGEAGLNGGIDIHVGRLIMQDGPQYALNQDVGQIESATGASVGGTIRVVADDSISMSSGANIINRRGSFESGSITLTSPSITLSQSVIRGRTNIERNAGAITLTAATGNLTLSNDSHILTSTLQSSGAAGPIVAEASDSIMLSGGSTIESSSTSVATGDGGPIMLTAANQVTLSGTGTALRSTTAGSGAGGTITVIANQIQLNNGGLITASTTGSGAGGSVNIGTGTFTSNASTVSSTATQAQGGDIAITAGQSATLNNGSSISASSTGTGNAGNVQINAGQTFLATDSSVTTQANQASGGTIKITTAPSGTVQLTNSTISASVLDGIGGGGSVDIDPQFVILLNSQILAQAVQGPGGNIFITTNFLLPDANSVISASSQFGVNGTVTIQSPNAPASGKIQPLGQSPLLATSLLNQRCAALAGGEFSSFTVAGRDSLPTEPGGWLSSPLYAAGVGEGQGVRGEGLEGAAPILSLRQIAPPGFLTQAFAVDRSASCQS